MNTLASVLIVLASFCLPWCSSARSRLSMETDELIKATGYPCENHRVITEDGYILSLFRIPTKGNSSRGSVLLIHGFMAASDSWLLQGTKKDLAYMLNDAGFDVWLGDLRGNIYSRKHVTLDPSNSEFWKFSVHEVGKYDLPALINYILKKTGEPKMFAVGHSMGVTAFYVMMSERPEYNKKIKLYVGLAPNVLIDTATISNGKKVWLKAGRTAIDRMIQQNTYEFFPRKGVHTPLSPLISLAICGDWSLLQDFCHDSIFAAFGKSSNGVSRKALSVMFTHFPSGSSVFVAKHLERILSTGEFKPLDMGKAINLKKYGTDHPALYNTSKLTCPVAMYSSLNDIVAEAKDTKLTVLNTPNVIHERVLKTFNHADFVVSRFAWKVIYEEILQLIGARA